VEKIIAAEAVISWASYGMYPDEFAPQTFKHEHHPPIGTNSVINIAPIVHAGSDDRGN
jgi:hypothetical protein